MLLEGKAAVIYGAGGGIGGAVATAFAREGATVHLTGRTPERLEAVAAAIRAAGGQAETALVDALDEQAVDAHADALAARTGGIDVSLNVIAAREVFGTPLAEMSLADFEQPITTLVRSTFLTARAAARHMIPRRSGVILTFGGHGAPMQDFNLGGFQVGLGAVEYLRRQLAAELGRHGIRVVGLQSAGIAEAIPEGLPGRDALAEGLAALTMLGRTASLADVGNTAVFAASDLASAITGTALNITCGTAAE